MPVGSKQCGVESDAASAVDRDGAHTHGVSRHDSGSQLGIRWYHVRGVASIPQRSAPLAEPREFVRQARSLALVGLRIPRMGE